MSDTKNQLDAMITYLLSLVWETGQKLRTASPAEAGTHAKTIRTLTNSINQLQWINYDADAHNAKPKPQPEPDAPQVEPAEWDQERQEIEEPKEV